MVLTEQTPRTGAPGALIRNLLGAGRRIGWALADQSLSSLTNLPLGLLAAHTLSSRDFGAVNLVFTVYVVALGISRATCSEPFTVRYSGTSSDHFRTGAESAIGLTLLLSVGMAMFVAGIGMLLAQPLRSGFLALGLVLPGLLFQDSWRYITFARNEGLAAFLNDLTWAILLFPSLTLLIVVDRLSLASLVYAWGCSAAGAGALACWNARLTPRPARAHQWIGAHRDLLGRYVVEFLLNSGFGQAMWFGVAAVAGVASLGSIRAAFLVLSPIYMLSQGLELFFLPRQVRASRRPEGDFVRCTFVISILEMTVAVVCGLAFWTLPTSLGGLLLGSAWQDARPLGLVLALAFVGRLMASGPTIGLRALTASRSSLHVGAITSLLTFAGGIGGALHAEGAGVAVGLLVACWVSSPICWWIFFRAMNEHDRLKDNARRSISISGENSITSEF